MSGDWQCPPTSQDDEVTATMQPGQALTVPVWYIISDAVSNTQSALTTAELSGLYTDVPVTSDQFTSASPAVTYAGPAAATCQNGSAGLCPFAKPKPPC